MDIDQLSTTHSVTVLGAVTVDGEAVTPRQRALISALVFFRHSPASIDELVELMWVDCPPASSRQCVHNQISRVRDRFGFDVITTTPSGYRLHALADIDEFANNCSASGAAHHLDDPTATQLATALRAWRGDPYIYLDHPKVVVEREALFDLRCQTAERLAQSHIESGTANLAIRSLNALTNSHPFRETAWGLLMIALYHDGRRIEALQVFDRLCGFLDDELGTHPSQMIDSLRHDIDLDRPVEPRSLQHRLARAELSVSA